MKNKLSIQFSIIIPTLNHASKLYQCLSYIANLSFDLNLFEVLIIDNGSTDNTKEIALSFNNKITNLHYVFCKSPGLMAARHKGCDEAKGNILCYIDDDSLVTEDWLYGIAESFLDDKVVLVGGPCIPEYEVNPPEWIGYFWRDTNYGRINTYLSLNDFGDRKLDMNKVVVLGCNYSIRKKTLLEFGGTHPDYLPEKYKYYQGDGESGLSRKIEKSKYRVTYHPKARIKHLIPESRLTVDYFCWRRYFNGIHISYSAIRRQHGVDNANDEKNVSIDRKICWWIKKSIKVVSKRRNYRNTNEPDEIKQIRKKIQESYELGYQHHQAEVKKDPKLLEWVLRENYLGENGKLPTH